MTAGSTPSRSQPAGRTGPSTGPSTGPDGVSDGVSDGETDAARPGWLEDLLPRRTLASIGATVTVGIAAALMLLVRAPGLSSGPVLVTFAVVIALVGVGDARTRRIPNRLNAIAIASVLPLLALARSSWPGSPGRAVLGALAAFGVYTALWMASRNSLGLGDVKFAPYLGAVLAFGGWRSWWQGLILGILAQGVIVAIGLLAGVLRRDARIAHGPAMCLGALAALLAALPRS